MGICGLKNTDEILENTDFAMFSQFPKEFYDGFHFSQIQPPVELFCKSNTVWDKIFRRSFLQKYDIKFPMSKLGLPVKDFISSQSSLDGETFNQKSGEL